jgi:hypothetical protein
MKSFFAIAALAIASVNAMIGSDRAIFILDAGPFLTVSRMDPIINPGKVAGHVHQVVGASNFRSKSIEFMSHSYWCPGFPML